MKKIILVIFTVIGLSVLLLACGTKVSKEISLEGFTISYDDYEDNKDFEKKDFYLSRNRDFNYVIYLNNEFKYEVKSVTINKTEYTSDLFSEESTHDKIIIKSNTESNSGRTKTELKEIIFEKNGKKLKGTINQNNDFNLNVKVWFEPEVKIIAKEEGINEIKLVVDLYDRDSIIDISKNDAYIVVFDGDKEVKRVNLKYNENEIELKNLEISKTYSYQVIAKYDAFDEDGYKERIIFEGNTKTNEPIEVKVTSNEETFITYNYELLTDLITLNKINLLKDDILQKTIDKTETKIENLEPGTDYVIQFEYSYTYNNQTLNQTFDVETNTFKLVYEELIRNGGTVKHPDGSIIKIPTYKQQKEEIRAIWFSTVSNIDMPKIAGNNITAFKEYIELAFDNIKAAKFNTVYFQIRPMNDSFFLSELAPWSRYLTGTEGKDPGFDVLGFVIEEAHKRGLEIHGWLNPYRVASNEGMFASMHESNFAKKNPDLVLTETKDNGASILDPGKPAVQNYIRAVISEIIEKYPAINGIHFDDYFYLSTFGETANSPDYQTYLTHRENSSQSIADFRRSNVTNMIKNIFNDVEAFNQKNNTNVRFGISPSGVWANKGTHPEGSSTTGYQHYSQLYADTKLWIKEGYIHYIVPQIYWDFTTKAAPFGHLVDWWSNVVKGTNVTLIIGQGLYRYRDTNWMAKELVEQIRYTQNHEEVQGVSFFTYKDIAAGSPARLVEAMRLLTEEHWINEAEFPWETNV